MNETKAWGNRIIFDTNVKNDADIRKIRITDYVELDYANLKYFRQPFSFEHSFTAPNIS